jgi:hypothetical protein
MTRLQYEKIQYRVDKKRIHMYVPAGVLKIWFGLKHHPHPSKKGKQRNDNNKFALRNTKIPIAQNHLQSGHLFGGGGREGGVPHANYVAQLDLEKSTTYPCIFVTLIY